MRMTSHTSGDYAFRSSNTQEEGKMALNAYLTMESERGGVIEGGATQAGREGLIEVIAFVHGVSIPQAASGLPTGKRQHKPFVFTKKVDKASPLLFETLVNNTNVPTAQLQVWRLSATGREEHYYTYEFVDATISGIRTEMLNNQYPENQSHEVREHISICYQRIVVVSEDGGTMASDTWEDA